MLYELNEMELFDCYGGKKNWASIFGGIGGIVIGTVTCATGAGSVLGGSCIYS